MSRFASVSLSWPRVLGAWALLLPGVIAFQPTFGGFRGYLAAFVGVTMGAVLALVAARFRWSIALSGLALVAAYLVLGGPIVLPETTIAGVVPTPTTLGGLALLTFQGWSDLLTVATPAGDLAGPASVPLMAGLIVGAVLVGVVRRTRAVSWPLLLPLAWLAFCIAFGVRTAPTAIWLGSALGVGALAWLTAHRLAEARDANSRILLRRDKGLTRTAARAISAGVVTALAAAAALGVNVAAAERVNRQVLRDDVTPPLNLHELVSPLMKYRLYELTLKDEVLFRVEGMPEGTRLRLAVLDTYDGNVFNVSRETNQYLNVGRDLPRSPEGDLADVTVTAVGYQDVWVPTFGDSSRLVFTGSEAEAQAEGLHYNRDSLQLLTTHPLAEGSSFRVTAVPVVVADAEEREGMLQAGLGRAPLADVTRVPDVLVKAATDWTAEATSTYQQLEIIENRLRSEGFYSDGSDGLSRSGHTTERLSTMFNAPQWVGDDEQYATAMAVMATQLGIPARVVMGFHPLEEDAPSDVWEVTGTEAHVWVEGHLDGFGWISFDPTPDRDKLPQTDVPRPKPRPKPQVDPPPNPPEKLPEEPIVADEDAVNVDEKEEEEEEITIPYVLYIVAAAAGAGVLAMTPFLVILAIKARRAARRRTRGAVTDQLAGAWDEVVDRARDLGHIAPTSRTRREAAANLAEAFPEAPVAPMAHRVDAAIFGAVEPDARHSEAAWAEVKTVRSALLGAIPWYSRPAAVFSTRSLRRRRTEAVLEKQRKNRRARTAAPQTQTKEY